MQKEGDKKGRGRKSAKISERDKHIDGHSVREQTLQASTDLS